MSLEKKKPMAAATPRGGTLTRAEIRKQHRELAAARLEEREIKAHKKGLFKIWAFRYRIELRELIESCHR